MSKKRKEQLSFDEAIYAHPADEKVAATTGAPVKSRSQNKAKQAVSASLQPFLPGLSRRGRPRSKNPVPASVRASESRKRRIEAGIKRLELFLDPEVASDLDLLSAHFKITRVEIISRLVTKAAKRIRLSQAVSATPSDHHSTS